MGSKAKIVIAGGGTGGHVYPALAIANGLVNRGVQKGQIIFFGSGRTIENELVPAHGYKLVTFPGRGLNRSETFRNLVNVANLSFAVLKALTIFIKSRPKIVIGVGGYASVPAIIAASILRINRVVHEQNSVVGRTNLIAQKLGAKLITTFPETVGAPKTSIRLGLPLSEGIDDAIESRRNMKINKRVTKRVVVTGGSLGSVALNEVVVKMVSKYKDDLDFEIVHICGKNNYQKTKELYEKADCFEKVALHSYRDDLSQLYALSDCVVSRAGAGTCVELEALGVPCVLVPLGSAPGNHQLKNSHFLQISGLAKILDQKNLNESILYELVKDRLIKADDIEPNVFNLESKSRISNYLISEYGLLNLTTGKN